MDYTRLYQWIVHQKLIELLPVHRAISIPTSQPFPPEMSQLMEDLTQVGNTVLNELKIEIEDDDS